MTMQKDSRDPLLGTRIREYEILEVIGKGGMGAVYRARHTLLDEERAIKVIHARLAGDRDFVDRFIREARMLIKLRHPNLVQLHDFGTLEEDSFFMVLELIRGESVLDRLHRLGRIPLEDAIKMVREAAQGLQNAHQKGIVHRDISPDNLMIVKDDAGKEIVKVLDFGIAKPLFEQSGAHTVTNMFIGKPEYCSPEQCGLLEEREVIDHRSDIYSLAVTMYYMIAGKLPFYSRTPQGYLAKHLSEAPKLLSSNFNPGQIPKKLDDLLNRALAKNRQERPASMEEFVRELDGVMADQIVQTVPENSQQIRHELQKGDFFAKRFVIEEKLGEGGMGSVYKANDKLLGVPVALKVLRSGVVNSQTALERFKREVILARKVGHPNACRIYDIGESEGIQYVSMEFLQGETLSDILRRQPQLSIDVGLTIIKQVLLALAEAHRVGIIHRDLKPQNIMVDNELRTWIMDFGISISAESQRVTQTGMFIGTPYYMAPEQFEGKNTDLRADIYSIGVILYEMFVGKLPFKGETPMAIALSHLRETPLRPQDVAPGVPDILDQIIMKALEKDPTQRYQSVRELQRALDPLLQATSSTTLATSREQLAHKMIAEHSYSKAIKLLKQMVQSQPEKPEWKKLLNSAISGKTRRDLHRVKSLLKKKNLIQAQLMLEKLRRFNAENERVITQVQRLEKILIKERDQTIANYVSEATSLLEARDYGAALMKLESAWHLQPDYPGVQELQEQALAMQKEAEGAQKLQSELDEARDLFQRSMRSPTEKEAEENAAQAMKVLELLLKKEPAHQPAIELVTEIQAHLRDQREAWAIRALDPAVRQLSLGNVTEAAALIENLAADGPSERLRLLLEPVQRSIGKISAALSREGFAKALAEVEDMKVKSSLLWKGDNENALSQLVDAIRKKESDTKAFHAKLEKGRELYSQRRIEEAIDCWRKALDIFPNHGEVSDLIRSAVALIRSESRFKVQLQSDLARVENLIAAKKFADAERILMECEEIFAPEYRLEESKKHLEVLKERMREISEKENTHREQLQKDLSHAELLLKQHHYEEASKKIKVILTLEPGWKEAWALQERITSAVAAEKAVEFRKAFDVGKEAFDRSRWQEALDHWELAAKAEPENQNLQQWIALARENIRAENDLKSNLDTTLSRCEQFLAQQKFVRAEELLNALPAIPDPSKWDPFRERIKVAGAAIQKEGIRQQRLAADLASARKLFGLGQERQAMDKLEILLKEEPQFREALDLKSEVGRVLNERELFENLKRESATILGLLLEERFKELQPALQRLQVAARNGSYELSVTSVVADVNAIAKALFNSEYQIAEEIILALPTRSTILESLEPQINRLASKIGEKKKGAATAAVGEGMAHFLANRWSDAANSFRVACRYDPENRSAREHLQRAERKVEQFAEAQTNLRNALRSAGSEAKSRRWLKAVSLCDEALKADYSEFALQEELWKLQDLRSSSVQSGVEEGLEVADRQRKAGKVSKARENYQQVLALDPDNAAAREGLASLENSERIAQAPAPGEASPGQTSLGATKQTARTPTNPTPPSAQKQAASPAAIAVASRKPQWLWIGAALVFFLLAGGVLMFRSQLPRKAEQATTPVSQPQANTQAPPPILPMANVAIIALPWAHVKVVPLDKNIKTEDLPQSEGITPVSLTLPAGNYQLELSNDSGSKPVVQKIELKAGQPNEFTIAMPGYNADRAVSQIPQ